ncbi:GerAB/ArcD/ProY family transporter [Brevibacillus sp. B_LB10_24]|uniref:GerAB/ArcD/ProY family transporter n=1 Tax=Brevibacillus sp. B_LB10_24 TaxID=3380645 RepID=UPI0038B982F1
MIKTGHLGKVELFALVTISGIADIFLTDPQQFAEHAGTAAWMTPIIAMLICMVIWAIIAPVLTDSNTNQPLKTGWLRVPILLLIIIFLVADAGIETRLFTETVVTTVLPQSPLSFVLIPFVLVTFYCAYKGVEGLSRISWIFFPVAIVGVISLLLLNWNWYRPYYLLPLWGRGIPDVLSYSLVTTGQFNNILLLVILSPLLQDSRDSKAVGYWSLIIIGFLYALVTLVFLMVFPYESALESPYPMYQLGRLARIGRFIQRLESGYVFIWISMALIKTAIDIWITSYLVAILCKMPVNRPLIPAIMLMVYVLAFFPKNFPETLSWYIHFVINWSWFAVIVLPAALLLWVRLRKPYRRRRASPR